MIYINYCSNLPVRWSPQMHARVFRCNQANCICPSAIVTLLEAVDLTVG